MPTLANMREYGCRGILVYCGAAPHCQHTAELAADRWPDDVTFPELGRRFVCTRCGAIGADVRPDWRPLTTRLQAGGR